NFFKTAPKIWAVCVVISIALYTGLNINLFLASKCLSDWWITYWLNSANKINSTIVSDTLFIDKSPLFIYVSITLFVIVFFHLKVLDIFHNTSVHICFHFSTDLH
ncbi:hypothetical protein MXB_4558, partial [Myxobolus squamalis]